MIPLILAIVSWAAIALLDATVKGRVSARYAPSTDVPWETAPDFWKDTGSIVKWRNVLGAIAILSIALAVNLREWGFAGHFASLFVLEFPLYWVWIAALGIRQKQWFDPWNGYQGPNYTYRLVCEEGQPDIVVPARYPRLGELPYRPMWLPGIYRALRLNKWIGVGIVVTLNIGYAIWKQFN